MSVAMDMAEMIEKFRWRQNPPERIGPCIVWNIEQGKHDLWILDRFDIARGADGWKGVALFDHQSIYLLKPPTDAVVK